MEFAIVEEQRVEPFPGLKGSCPLCGRNTLSKCGPKVIWHWAHSSRRHCDPWWENETEWHRAWKAYFPAVWREQVHFDISGEKHIADVKTPTGLAIEFQNSAMPLDELKSREVFYGDMIWIVNGLAFIKQFHILDPLPAPDRPGHEDVIIRPGRRNRGLLFTRLSDNPDQTPHALVEIHGGHELRDEIDRTYCGHHLYEWVRPRSVWFDATKPVYLDFGGDELWHLKKYDAQGLSCVQRVAKANLIQEHGGAYTSVGHVVIPPGQSAEEISSEITSREPVVIDDADIPF